MRASVGGFTLAAPGGHIMETFLLVLLVVVGPAFISAFCVSLLQRWLRGKTRAGHNDVVVPIFAAVGTIYAVMLGFLVIMVWEDHGSAQDNVAREAANLTSMYRMTNGMNPVERAVMRKHIRNYTRAVIDEEWGKGIVASGKAAPEARRELANIYREFSSMPPETANSSINSEFLAQFSVVTTERNQRTQQARSVVPSLLWIGLITGAIVVVGMSCMLSMEAVLPHMLVTGGLALIIGLLLFIIVVLATPFKGALAIGVESFEHAWTVYDSVDRGS